LSKLSIELARKIAKLAEDNILLDLNYVDLSRTYPRHPDLWLKGFASPDGSLAFGMTNSSILWMKIDNYYFCLDSENDIDKVDKHEDVRLYRDKVAEENVLVVAKKRGNAWEFIVGDEEALDKNLAHINGRLNQLPDSLNKSTRLLTTEELTAGYKAAFKIKKAERKKKEEAEKREKRLKKLGQKR